MKPKQHSYSEEKLDALQRVTFDYFLKEANPENGLIPDSTRRGSPCSIAATGFALASYPVGKKIGSKLRRFFDYEARGIPDGPDDGTLAPWAVIASLPFAPEIVLPSMQYFDEAYPEMTSHYGFKCSFNPTFSTGSGNDKDSSKEWISKGYYGLDQGPIVLMIENYRTGFLWRLMRGCSYIVEGLRRAGFEGAWLQELE